jgi:hypothetical protein
VILKGLGNYNPLTFAQLNYHDDQVIPFASLCETCADYDAKSVQIKVYALTGYMMTQKTGLRNYVEVVF